MRFKIKVQYECDECSAAGEGLITVEESLGGQAIRFDDYGSPPDGWDENRFGDLLCSKCRGEEET
jgi:hypothetical protein